MQKKDKVKLFINQFLRGGTKCIPFVGTGIEEIIFGFKDKQQAQEEKEILWKALDDIKKSQKIDQMTGLQVIELLLDLTKEYDVVQKSINQFIAKIQSKNQQIIKYLTTTIDFLNNSLNLKYYIDLKCRDEEHKRTILIKDYICEWLKDPNVTTLAILGDFGTGKTTYSQKLTLESSKRYLDNPQNNYLPIMIDLRSFTHLRNVEELLKNALMWKGIDYEDFFQIFQDSKILFIFDGFDEMSTDTRRMISFENFLELNKLNYEKNKLIITSRTHYFRQKIDEGTILKFKDKNFDGILLKDGKKISIVYLENLNEEDIKRYLKLYFRDEWKIFHNTLYSIYNLPELAHRPILLNLIAQTLPEIVGVKGEITPYKLYDIYINRWAKREEWRDIRSEDVLFLMEELAFKMFLFDRTSITPQELTEIIKENYEQNILFGLMNLENFDGKIRTASFLYRDDNDNYKFMHKSFMEFFIAKKLAKEVEIGNRNEKCFSKKVLTHGIFFFLKDLVKDKNKLYKILEFTKNKSFEQVQYLGGNAITVLKLLNENFEAKDFSTTVLSGANLSNTDLGNSKFKGAALKETCFENAILENADFSFSDLEEAKFGNTGRINCIVWSPDDKFIAGGGDDTFIRIWNTKRYGELEILAGHKGSVNCLCWSPDCSMLASGGSDKNIIIWDTFTRKPITTVKLHSKVVSLSWDKNKNYLISGDLDGHIITLNADKDWEIEHTLSKYGKISQLNFINSLNYLVVSIGNIENKIEILEGDTYNQIHQLDNFSLLYGINEDATLVYVAQTLKEEGEESDETYHYTWKKYNKELIHLNLNNFVSEKIKSWECKESRGNELEIPSIFYDSNNIYGILNISFSDKGEIFSIILYHYYYTYDSDYDERKHKHKYYLIFYDGNEELNKILLEEKESQSDWDEINTIHPFTGISYSNNSKYLALIHESDKIIKILDADSESPDFGKCLHTIKQQINCRGMNIQGARGLTKEQINFLKVQGAIEK